MKVGIDASQAAKEKKTGIEYLSSQLILNLLKIDQHNKYLLFTNSKLPRQFSTKNAKVISIPGKRFWHQFRLPLALIKYKPEVFLEIGYMLPDFTPKKSICFIHDLAHKYYPNAYCATEKLLLNATFRRAKKAKSIGFISQNTRNDYKKFYPGFKGKTFVAYPGFNADLFHPILKPRDVLNLKSKYILYVGRLESRKNITKLISAYKIFRKESKLSPKLVLAGKEGYGIDRIREALAKLDFKIKKNIIMAGYIAEKDLPHLYAGAELFVFPSLYEGFGIPILEAMACKIPVICSESSSLPEAGGNAVLYFDPNKPKKIAKLINKVLTSADLRQKMIQKGLRQANKFSYKKMAEKVLEIIEEL